LQSGPESDHAKLGKERARHHVPAKHANQHHVPKKDELEKGQPEAKDFSRGCRPKPPPKATPRIQRRNGLHEQSRHHSPGLRRRHGAEKFLPPAAQAARDQSTRARLSPAQLLKNPSPESVPPWPRRNKKNLWATGEPRATTGPSTRPALPRSGSAHPNHRAQVRGALPLPPTPRGAGRRRLQLH